MTDARQTVLIVDDSPDGREMLAEYLTFRGFEVIEAMNGEEALTLARNRRPAVILMDLQMPGIGGWEATRQLKADPATKDIIVIAVTAHALTPDEAIARHAGCDGFIAKPYEISAVGDTVRDVLQRGRRGHGCSAEC
jgi:two-component system cell cycle response regulator DivK